MEEVPLPHRPLLALHQRQALAAEHDEPFVGGFGVVVAVGLPRLQDVDVNADGRIGAGHPGPVKVAPHPKSRHRLPRHLSEVEDEPAFPGRQPALCRLVDASFAHV
jgi:hypothetical protein